MRFPRLLVILSCVLVISPWVPTGAQPAAPFRILVTNDDGVRAPGLLALARALTRVGEVKIVAPADNQSAKGHSLQVSDPVYVDAVQLPGGLSALSATATPATCVKVALGALLPDPPHLVVSGINRDQNLGRVAYISGTVAGAREAALQGIPAIAVSLLFGGSGEPDYEPAAELARRIAGVVKEDGLEAGVFLNVNVPPGPIEAIKGIRVTRQSPQSGTEKFLEFHRPPTGRRYFWNTYAAPTGGEEGDDVWAVYQGYVAVTPLRATEFDARSYEKLKDAFRN